jgi:hypothetical protein
MEKTESRDTILKSISSLLDEAISDYQKLCKADYKMQPDENGDMPAKAGQEGDDFIKPLKKEDEKKDEEKKDEDEKKDEKKDEEKKDEAPVEMKKEDEKKDEKKDEDDEEKDEDEKEYGKFMKFFQKALVDLGLVKTDEEPVVEEKIEKSVKEESPLLKSFGDKMEILEKKIEKVIETVDKIASAPAVPVKRSLDGLSAIKKSTDETEKPKISKSENLKKLLDLMKSGDSRVSANLVAKYEMFGNENDLKGII